MVYVTHITHNETTCRYEEVYIEQKFKTYADAVRHFGGEQDWYNKNRHRFTVGRDLYLMSKTHYRTYKEL